MKHFFTLGFVFLLFNLGSFAQINFKTSEYQTLIEESKESSKYLFVDFRADWCRPCLQMERTTFKDSSLSSFVNQKMVAFKADADLKEIKVLTRKFKVNALPTIIILDPQTEEVLLRVVGYTPASILEGDLKAIKDKNGNKIFDQNSNSDSPSKAKKKCSWFRRKKK